MSTRRFAIAVTWGLLGLTLLLLPALLVPGLAEGSRAEGLAGPPAAARLPSLDVLTVCPAGPPDCQYTSIQAAMDDANEGDVIKVAAGIYTDSHARPAPAGLVYPALTGIITQVLYIDKAVTVRGGYTAPGFADPPDPAANPTTLDALGQGRVLFIAGNIQPVVEGLRITGGDATGLGGGPWDCWVGGGGIYVLTATATIQYNWVLNNTTGTEEGCGGGIFMSTSGATLRENTISGNSAYDYGGGVYLLQSSAMLSDNIVEGNQALCSGYIVGGGGGLYLDQSPATLEENTITANVSQDYGGGLYLRYSDARVLKNVFSNNEAVFGHGGGILLDGSTSTLYGNIISGNHCNAASAYSFDGGGVAAIGSHATLIHNTVTDNAAAHYYGSGGGVAVSGGHATLVNNTISANTAGSGGGVSITNSDLDPAGNLVSGNIITGNLATGLYGGAGFYTYQSTVALTGNTITGNRATGSNTAGGGLYADWLSVLTMINNVVADNEAYNWGSGVYVRDSSLHMVHTTIARNRNGDGSGVYTAEGHPSIPTTVALTNTIIVSQTYGVRVAAGDTIALEATLWGDGAWANGVDWFGPGTIATGTVNFWGDPAFVDPNAGDHHLAPGSAALDRGVEAGVLSDLDHQPRPYQAPDLGADEYWPPGVLKHIYVPLVLRAQP
jgi:parallel beta-helix repeat protein